MKLFETNLMTEKLSQSASFVAGLLDRFSVSSMLLEVRLFSNLFFMQSFTGTFFKVVVQ